MVDPLTEAENLCRQVLGVLEGSKDIPAEGAAALKKRIQDLLLLIAESKKKIMVRSPQGQKLTAEIQTEASGLYEAVANLSKSGASGKAAAEVSDKLSKFGNSVKKLEIYWKSFEYATT